MIVATRWLCRVCNQTYLIHGRAQSVLCSGCGAFAVLMEEIYNDVYDCGDFRVRVVESWG